jgi:ABC-2 type transport system permease protein
VKYRRSVLGIAWSLLNPIMMMLVLNAVFSHVFRFDVENFPLYLISGQVIYQFFSDSTSGAIFSIVDASSLIKKVYIPKYIFPLEKCVFALINLLLSMIAVIAVMLIQGVYPTWTILFAPLPILYCFILCIGFSLILSALTLYFRDIQHLYGVLLTVWMYITPIIYPIELIQGNSLIVTIIHCNPLFYYVDTFRQAVMYNTIPSLTENLICIGIAVGTLAIGCFTFSKLQKKFILHI